MDHEVFKRAAASARVGAGTLSYQAAKLVMVDGLGLTAAGASVGVSKQATQQAVKKVRAWMEKHNICACCGCAKKGGLRIAVERRSDNDY